MLFDLVYLHCGRGAVFIKDNPDFVVRNEGGTIAVGAEWPFARLNFRNPNLRKYLLENMKTFIKEYDADGFRCDVGDMVPLDFWKESFQALRKIKSDLITLDEGDNPEAVKGIFDLMYSYGWNAKLTAAFSGKLSARVFREYCIEEEKGKYGDNTQKLIRTIDTHDSASNVGLDRYDITMTTRGVEAALVITSTYEGVPFMWNGYEICDNAENCMFSNRNYGRRSEINWSRGFTDDGVRRMEFVKKMHDIVHTCEAVSSGTLEWVDNDAPDEVISYLRIHNDTKVLVAVNSKNKRVKANLRINPKKIYLESGVSLSDAGVSMEPYSYMIAEVIL